MLAAFLLGGRGSTQQADDRRDIGIHLRLLLVISVAGVLLGDDVSLVAAL
jgi:hypothetical protein